MAQRRMFSLQVVDTDRFMDMPASTQALYFHLGMHGDDDGFVASPKRIARSAGCSDDDLRLLAAKGWIIPFDSGVVAITDWKIHNTLRNDRYRGTIYQREKEMLQVDRNDKYLLAPEWQPNGNQMATKWQPDGNQMAPDGIPSGYHLEPQRNLTEHNLTEHNLTEHNLTERNATEQNQTERNLIQNKTESKRTQLAPTPAGAEKKSYGKYGWVKLTDREYETLLHDLGQEEVKRCIAYLDESAQSTGNKNAWQDWALVIRRCQRGSWGKGHGALQPEPPKDCPKAPGAVYV